MACTAEELTETKSEEMTWMQLSAKAFKRDWDSEEDIIYDSKNC